MWIAGSPNDFFTICNQQDVKRRTIFKLLMLENRHVYDSAYQQVSYEPAPMVENARLRLMDKSVSAVPILGEEFKNEEEN
ncbi:MAG: hypothetical protein K2Q45_03835 [Nitrosomonas sp.]|nr:hypothetical protein [Nitrosomonas sp.]